MSDIEAAIAEEIEALTKELEADPRYAKLTKLRELADLYRAPQRVGRNWVDLMAANGRIEKRVLERNRQALDTAARLIADRSGPTITSVVLGLMDGAGEPYEGSRDAFAALLSRDERFVSHGRAGWTIAPTLGGSREGAEDEDPEVNDLVGWPRRAASGDGSAPP